jgi:uncharacterized membrane protein YhaH (DUF805 family)
MNWFLKCIRQYADFKGRARRTEYWMFTLVCSIISYGLQIIAPFCGDAKLIISGFLMIFGLVLLVPSFAVAVRRLHDVGKSGWFYLIVFIPIIGMIWLFVLFCTDSQYGENKWGPNPKGLGNKKGNTPAEKEEFSEWDTDSEEEAKL